MTDSFRPKELCGALAKCVVGAVFRVLLVVDHLHLNISGFCARYVSTVRVRIWNYSIVLGTFGAPGGVPCRAAPLGSTLGSLSEKEACGGGQDSVESEEGQRLRMELAPSTAVSSMTLHGQLSGGPDEASCGSMVGGTVSSSGLCPQAARAVLRCDLKKQLPHAGYTRRATQQSHHGRCLPWLRAAGVPAPPL